MEYNMCNAKWEQEDRGLYACIIITPTQVGVHVRTGMGSKTPQGRRWVKIFLFFF